MKKSERIQDTTINSSVLEYFHNVQLPDAIKTALSTHGLGNLVACIRTGQVYNHSPSNIHDGTLKKIIDNVSLQMLIIFPKIFCKLLSMHL